MKILLIGSGGREHAIAWKLIQSPQVSEIFVSPGNDGIKAIASNVALNSQAEIINFIKEKQIDITFIGPEVHLVEGLVDAISEQGFKVFGPGSSAAALEGSKAFAKDFMKRHNIPTSAYKVFEDENQAKYYLDQLKSPYVIKADGLAGGKGVLICKTKEEAQLVIHKMIQGKAFGESGKKIVIEEFLEGEEASYFVLSDGINFLPLASAQDHKRIGELDTGLNTGGMGAYSPAPVVTEEIEKKIINDIVKPTIEGMAQENHPYKGVLYIGLMIKDGSPYVIEYNCRFGDPECQPILMRLKSDLLPLAIASIEGNLDNFDTEWHPEAAACIILASKGYPQSYQKNKIIKGLNPQTGQCIEPVSKSYIFHAGTKFDGSFFNTAGGRVLGVTAMGDNLESALKNAYQEVSKISWDDITYRRDIGLKGLLHFRDNRPEKSVAILIGSKNDLKIAKKAADILDRFSIGYVLEISSAHRCSERTRKIIKKVEESGVEVFIAMAGMAAHLPGVIAAETAKPVIGVPINSSFEGLDSLMAIVQMPPGIPVATVAANGSINAALLAVQILSLRYTDLRANHKLYRLEMEQKIIASQEDAGLTSVI